MYPPIVTGISPKEGAAGTKVTIRGENLGTGPDDLIGLIICGVDCLMSADWKSPAKILACSGAGIGVGDIIVETVSGGRGTSTVQFKGVQEAMGPLKESAVWVDEKVFFNMSFGRKRPSSPSALLQEDPLGLSTEGNEGKRLEEDLEELFPGMSGDLTSNKFSPSWFLLENHLSTTYNDLCAGLNHLQRKVSNQNEGEIAFLKANVGSVLEQVDTLCELKCKFESDIHEYGRKSTEVLEQAIFKCKDEADKLFDDVLQRKDRADSTRNAINVLKRFHFLFYLPVHTERNIQKGDYDIVINDYARAKSLFGETQIPLFKQFYNEVENKIEGLRHLLSEQLVKMPSTLEAQKKIIRNLYHLETPGEPAWACLCAQYEYILCLIVDARDLHLNRERADHDLGGGTPKIGGGTTLLNTPPSVGNSRNSTPAAKYNKIMASSVGDWQASAPIRVLLVDELSESLCVNFPDMWRLSQAYFGGELLPDSAHVDHGKYPQCKEMILELLVVSAGVIRGAIIPHTLDLQGSDMDKFHVWLDAPQEYMTPWLPQVLRHVRTVYTKMVGLDLPSDALNVVKNLLYDLRVHCLTSLFQQTVEHMRTLHISEDWQVLAGGAVTGEEEGEGEGGHTALPLTCESVTMECAQLVKEAVLQGDKREVSLLESPDVVEGIAALVLDVVLAFAESLGKLTICDPDEIHQTICPLECGEGNGGGEALPPFEVQQLITLSNCSYCRRVMLPRLGEALIKAGYPQEISDAVSKASKTYTELEETLFQASLEERVDPIIGMIERSMYLGNYDWAKVRHQPKEVKTYVKEILLNVAQVHAEVVSVWPGLVPSLMTRVVEGIGEEMSRLMSCVASFSHNGALQAHIDMAALNITLQNYITHNSQSTFQEAIEVLPKLTSEQKRVKEDVLRSYHSNMRFLLACFLDLEPIQDVTNPISIL